MRERLEVSREQANTTLDDSLAPEKAQTGSPLQEPARPERSSEIGQATRALRRPGEVQGSDRGGRGQDEDRGLEL